MSGLIEPHPDVLKDVLMSRGSLTPSSLLTLQKQMLRQNRKKGVCSRKGKNKQPTDEEMEVTSVDWQLFTSRQEDLHSTTRISS